MFMKNYNLHDYAHITELKKDLITDLNADFADLEVKSNKYTNCEILEITKDTVFDNKPDVMVDVSCNAGIVGFCFRKAIELGLIILPEDKLTLFNNYMERYDIAYRTWEAEVQEQIRLDNIRSAKEAELRKIRIAKAAEEKAAREAEKKFQIRIAKATDKFSSDIKRRVDFKVDTIDWLKENVLSISATIPSHLEKAFVEVFGDQPHKTVDSRRKTSGGYSMKFAPTFSLRVKKDATTVPVELANKIKDNVLHDTSYIANLVKAYDFKFGKSV